MDIYKINNAIVMPVMQLLEITDLVESCLFSELVAVKKSDIVEKWRSRALGRKIL